MRWSSCWEDSQIGKQSPAFYWVRSFSTVFKRAGQLSVSWGRWSPPPYSISFRPILVLPSHLIPDIPSGFLPHVSPPKPISISPLPLCATCPSHLMHTERKRRWINSDVVHRASEISFFGVFAKLRKATISVVVSVRLSIPVEQLDSHRTDFHGIWYLNIFRKPFDKILFFLKSNNNNGTSHADQYTFFITSRSFLLRMRNVSYKSCRENQNTHFVFRNFFFKIVPFMR